jgi:hypothetical protein
VSYNHTDYPIRLTINMQILYVVSVNSKQSPPINLPTPNDQNEQVCNSVFLPSNDLSAIDLSILSTDRPTANPVLPTDVDEIVLSDVVCNEEHQGVQNEMKPLSRLVVNTCYIYQVMQWTQHLSVQISLRA